MRIALYGSREECVSLITCAEALPELQYRVLEFGFADNYDGFLSTLKEAVSDVVIVLANGAEGMEGVIASKSLDEKIPVIWFSDDKGFGVQAHRLDCVYFATKPVTDEKLAGAYKAYRRKIL